MRRTKFLAKTLSMLGFITVTTAARADVLDLMPRGTSTVGGYATLNLASPGSPVLLNSMSSRSLDWNAQVTGGHFFADAWELGAVVESSGTFAKGAPATIGFGPSTRYYFDTDSIIYPYVGTSPTFSYNTGNKLWTFRLPAMAGFLIGLNCAVALDIGVVSGFSWPINPKPKRHCSDQEAFGYGTSATGFDLAVGYLGVKGFF